MHSLGERLWHMPYIAYTRRMRVAIALCGGYHKNVDTQCLRLPTCDRFAAR